MVTYAELCTAIVKNKISSIGIEKTKELAKECGINIDDQGNVAKADKNTLKKLVESCKKVSGNIGVIFAKGAIAPLIKGQNIDLPDSLK